MESNMNFLQSFMEANWSDDCFDVDAFNNMDSLMELEKVVLPKIQSLKDMGNHFFKENHIDAAGFHYDKGCKLLSFAIGTSLDYDIKVYVDLAISLSLNLAACTLKISEYEATKDLCTLVLSFFPHNVKALFRRAMAFMKLNIFMEAQKDLERALGIEPNNKDIIRELNVVRNHLNKNDNGKRCMEETLESDVIRKGKRPILDLDNGEVKMMDECGSSIGEFDSSPSPAFEGNDSSRIISYPKQSPIHKRADMVLDTKLEKGKNCSKVVEFVKKGGHSSLRLSASTYQKLLEGKKVSFYNKFQLSIMEVKILKPPTEELGDTISTLSKKKRKKRKHRSRKGKSILDCNTKVDMPHASTTKSVSLPVDLNPHPKPPHQNEINEVPQVRPPAAQAQATAALRPLCSSSTPKILQDKGLLTGRHHCRGRQPLRHISPPCQKGHQWRRYSPSFSVKFPRSSNVSMSRHRYSSDVQVLKKIKTSFSDTPHSNRPFKKTLVNFIYSPSLACNMNNVVVAPYPEGSGAIM